MPLFTNVVEEVFSEVLLPESGTLDKTEQASQLVEVETVPPPIDLRDEYPPLIGVPGPPLEARLRRLAPVVREAREPPGLVLLSHGVPPSCGFFAWYRTPLFTHLRRKGVLGRWPVMGPAS